ncbi:vacuolar fusion protein CCZ1 [Danaus plexippus plexippus]|uniref:Vacuolar fusion protein CCZ1 n=2 Tax=Danaus plexippus TaxID=13037 RepID=A0A212EL52_DANPL|nr:vacuolar fusion protein CCZ1 [Danaus plexippus plexippus]
MVLVVRIPYAAKTPSTPGESKEVIETSVIYDLLVSAYKMFRMFVGPFKDIPPEDIYTKCEQFFTPYIMSRNIANDLSNIIQGINYLPLEKNSFFKVVCFIDLLEITYPDFKCVSFVYNEQLIWNGLATNDMLTLYQYLVQTLLPKQVEKEIQGGAVTAAVRHGRFISPPEGIRTSEDLKKLHKVYLMREDDTEMKQYYLIIYRTLSATVCFTIDVNTTLDLDTFKSLDAFIGPKLSTIASSISEQCAVHALQNAQLSSSEHKFLYFNRLNLACKTSTPPSLTPSTAVKPEVLSIIAGIHADRKSLGNYGEIIIKTPDEYWITGKSSNDREFYVIIQEKNANLKDIADEVKRVCEEQMKGIFFYPI